MPGEQSSKTQRVKRRGWFRRITRWFLVGLALLLAFHRPLIHFAAQHSAVWFAKREHMILDLRVGGNIWSTLELSDVSIRDDGSGKAPLERLTLDRARVEYDLWNAIRADWTRIVRQVDIGNVNGVARIVEPDPNKPKEPPTPVAEVLEKILSQSLSPVQSLKIGRVDFEVANVASIRGLSAEISNRQPGYIAWEKIHVVGLPDIDAERAELETSDSAFKLAKLRLFPNLVIKRLSLNRVTPTLPRGGLEVVIGSEGGEATLRVQPATKDALDVLLEAKDIRVNEIASTFDAKLAAPIVLDSFRATFNGAPEQIEKSAASVSFIVRVEEKAPVPAVTMRGQAKWERDLFNISELTIESKGLDVHVGGEVTVPVKGFHPSRLGGAITWRLAASAPALLSMVSAEPAEGSVGGSGKLRIENGEAILDGDLSATNVAQGIIRIDSAKVHLDARRKIESFSDILATFGAGLTVNANGIHADGIRVDDVTLKASMDGRKVTIEQLSVAAGENRISSTASATLKPDASGLATAPEVDLQLAAPRIEQFGVVVNGAALSGAVTAEGRIRLEGALPVGNLQFKGADLLLGDARVGSFSGQVKFENGEAVLDSATVDLGGAGNVAVQGRIGLGAPMAYSGSLNVNLADLAKLDPLLAAMKQSAKLGGSLKLDWTGDGKVAEIAHSGRLSVSGKDLRHGEVRINDAQLGAAYTPQEFETSELLVVADKTKLAGRVQWKNARLEIPEITVSVAGTEVASGQVSVPFDPTKPEGILTSEEPMNAKFHAEKVDVPKLLSSFGMTAPVAANVSAELVAGGAPSKPDVKLTIEARDVKSSKTPSLAPAEVNVNLVLANAQLLVDGVVKQRDIQPATLRASVPVDLAKLRENPESFRELPLDVRLKLPPSSLGIVPRLAPAVARIDGTVSADVSVRGTIGKPNITGETAVSAKSVRLASQTAPPVSNVSAKLSFGGDAVTVNELRGEIGGGSFRVEGGVKLPSLDQPVFDLRLRSDKVLVFRDDSTTVRADADVLTAGPLASATVSGSVLLTQSRFYKDVDILPLSLPGKPKPKARSVPSPKRISFPEPPLRDWKFDLAIKTREEDPFLVRGNLAKGAVSISLKLGGTGLNPFLTGQVVIDNFTAVLPASKLEVRRGSVTFTEQDPFEPQLDIQGETKIRETTITIYITGPASSPTMELESQPPLAQKDIVSLLTTGTTSGEIGSNASTLATKAALIKIKQWYRKTFHRGMQDTSANGEESFLDRFEVDVGNVDARSGRPEVTGSFRVNDQLYFLGEIDMEGQPIGRMKYLLRFR